MRELPQKKRPVKRKSDGARKRKKSVRQKLKLPRSRRRRKRLSN